MLGKNLDLCWLECLRFFVEHSEAKQGCKTARKHIHTNTQLNKFAPTDFPQHTRQDTPSLEALKISSSALVSIMLSIHLFPQAG
jgi:hypothetical protein